MYDETVPARLQRRSADVEMGERLNGAGSPRTAVGERARDWNDEVMVL